MAVLVVYFFSLKSQAIRGLGWILYFSHLVRIKQTLNAAQAESQGQHLQHRAEQTHSWGELYITPAAFSSSSASAGCLTLISAGVWPSEVAVERRRGASLSFFLRAEVLVPQKQLAVNVLKVRLEASEGYCNFTV